MKDFEKHMDNAVSELRRGTLVLAILSRLDKPCYGYSLIQTFSKAGLKIDQNTLYPLLRRLEKQGLVESSWSVEESRPRKYYKISGDGELFYRRLLGKWHDNVEIIKELTGSGK